MPKYKELHLDNIIREALSEKMNECPPPLLEASEAWNQLQRRRDGKRKTSPLIRTFRKPLLISASLLFILLFATAPKSGIAFNQFTDIFHTIQGNVVYLFGKSEGESDGPGLDGGTFEVIDETEIVSKQMSLEEAKKAAHFPILTPKNLMNEFQLEEVTVMDGYEEQVEAVYLSYVGKDRGFMVTEMPIENPIGFGASMDKDDVTIEQVEIKGQKGSLVIFKNGTAQLIWMTQSHYLSIEGKLTKEEILIIAKSI
ncbi:DUF4367 domain-containing protein [Lederbergia wuyishanensis]|uniref:DUF4367 domain-containing protein n=1 Tax=Lederbergia wuyishanensis TaxID=1347903 RepID=A0ABU0DAS4_9BACI|nr:DUF4367 domain-containing protein [Lederbergia wuyishanensis]MCJ8009664.1 DUF4367 domain-containing protein [Lederbergia wuyishanensis]MDQ0345462.1 hypothetical protein [Lederbergia wuyishanensis]